MDGSPDDERRRRLQRIAYGAEASPEERAAAAAELHALADAATTDPPQPVEEAHGDPTAPPTPQPDEARTTSSTGRWAIGAGVAALVVGLAVGTQLPGLITADPSTPGADAGRRAGDAPDASLITGPGTPVEHTP
ncbi:MAG TPA: hypothetical protein VGE78_01800, partial [Agromyces sp.]